ncbi:MAG: DUF2341 domain-containing protein [Petrotogales bacterium]
MRKNKNNQNFGRLVVFLLFIILVTVSAAQGLIQIGVENKTEEGTIDSLQPVDGSPPLFDDPYYTWEDGFDTMEWIEADMSYNFTIVDSVAKIKNTYPVWTDSDWTRLKPINLTNNAGQTLLDYAINLTIDYDPDMQEDYEDIRFKHEDYPTTWLDYWIESKDSSSASVWVNIPEISTGSSMMFLFYGNPDATDQSDFYSVFSDWEEKWANDEKITYHGNNEGAWDPDVCHGNGEFLVAWEEGQPFKPPHTYGNKQEIRASIYEPDGTRLVFDKRVFKDSTTYYLNTNPSIAYGGGKWFVAWEHYGAQNYPPHNPSITTMDIKARMVKRSGSGLQLGSVINVCNEDNCQADANVEFDTVNNQFCVVWEDARGGTNNYNIYGKLYDIDGDEVGSADICTEGNSQCEPWVAFDPVNEQYMIVWEEGLSPDTGPFSIYAGLFDEDLIQLGDTITIATGDDDTDYNFPCVCFCEETERFLVTWNDGDISDEDWRGDIWGQILDESGDVVVDTFTIKSGNFIRSDIVPYLSTSFFVSYDDNGNIWGKLVSSEGDVFTDDVQLSASNSADADWANIAVGDEKIFVAWEDTRVYYSPPWNDMPDAYGNIWHLNIPSSSEVSYVFGTEKKLILTAQITSKVVEPDNLVSWYEFGVDFDESITFDILDSTGTIVLIEGASNGEDLSGIDPEIYPGLRLQAHFTRDDPSYSPTLDYWSVTYIGIDEEPPETIVSDIIGEQGDNGWYTSNVKIELDATDGLYGSGVNHTYFKIDDGDIQEYDDAVGIKLPQHATGDPNTPFGTWDVWYWSVDKAGNQEPSQGPVHIKIDKAPPYCNIWDPPDRGSVPKEGDFWIQATATDNGSGIHYVSFDIGPPYEDPVKVYSDDPPGSENYKWFCDRSFEKKQWKHIIAQAYDYAGHMYESNIYVFFPYNFAKIKINIPKNTVHNPTSPIINIDIGSNPLVK